MISLWPRRKKTQPELPRNRLEIIKEGKTIKEFMVEKAETRVGRGSDCELQLNDPSVSRHHALFTRERSDLFVEDLESTNGTQVNGRTVVKQLVRIGDELNIGNFTLRVHSDKEELEVEEEDDLDKTVVIKPSVVAAAREQLKGSEKAVRPKAASLRFFKGPDKGTTKQVDRSLYTVGKPGGNVAVIARRPQGFFLLHIGGEQFPKINNQEIDSKGGVQLNEGDVIEVGEIVAEINFSA